MDNMYLDNMDIEAYKDVLLADRELRANVGELSDLKTSVKDSVVNAINSIPNVQYNVKAYGAVGDGVADDYQAFVNAIAAVPAHGTLYVPIGLYRLSEEIVITKPIRILGEYSGWDVYDANPDVPVAVMNKPLIKSESDDYGIYVKCLGFTLENVALEMTATYINGGLCISNENSTVEKFNRFNRIVNCSFINNTSTWGAGVTCKYTGLTTIERCLTYGFTIGYFITQLNTNNKTNTSICLLNCWAENYHSSGYNLGECYYGCLLNCASDSINENTNGYVLNKCFGTKLVSCGSEKNVNGFIFDQCYGCSVSGSNVGDNTCENAILLRYDGAVNINSFYATGDKSNPNYHDVKIQNLGVHATFISTNISNIYYVDHEIGVSELPSAAQLASTDSLVILT